jgi:cytochrome bd-type quinol oxidase subunit 2
MTELAIFLLFQVVVNLLAWRFINGRVQLIFYSLAYVIFGLLMFIYPIGLINFHYNNLYEDSDIRCGNAYIGLMFFMWLIGLPVVLIVQFLFYRFLFRKQAKKHQPEPSTINHQPSTINQQPTTNDHL